MLKPLLFVDIDGVISLFGFEPASPPAGAFASIDGIPHYISTTAGACLARLIETFAPVWCSGWEEKANEYLPRALGLSGPFPFLTFERAVGRTHAHWKLDAIDAYAGRERSLAWIDDAFDDSCECWASDRPGATLLVRTDPAVGLTEAHTKTLLAWTFVSGGAP